MMAGEQVLAVGNMYINSTFTYASQEFQYAALYLGQHHVIGGFAETLDGEQVEELYLKLRDAFRKSNLNEVILLIRTVFGDKSFSFDDLFGDAKEQLLNRILQKIFPLQKIIIAKCMKNVYAGEYAATAKEKKFLNYYCGILQQLLMLI